MSTDFLPDSKVRFTKERLSVLSPRDRRGLEGRIGVVQTEGARANKPTVYFPAEGSRPDIRLFRVDQRQLELVEGPPEAPPTPKPDPFLAQAMLDSTAAAAAPAADAGGATLSQDELDNFFD